jgi:hypothetical protein
MTAIDPRPVHKGSALYNSLVNRILKGATRVASCGRRVNPSDTTRALYAPHAEGIIKTCGQHARIAALVIEHLRGIVGWECHVIGHGRRAAESAIDHGVTMDGDDRALDREDKLVAKLMRLALDRRGPENAISKASSQTAFPLRLKSLLTIVALGFCLA